MCYTAQLCVGTTLYSSYSGHILFYQQSNYFKGTIMKLQINIKRLQPKKDGPHSVFKIMNKGQFESLFLKKVFIATILVEGIKTKDATPMYSKKPNEL